jgi:hypothetical protein
MPTNQNTHTQPSILWHDYETTLILKRNLKLN